MKRRQQHRPRDKKQRHEYDDETNRISGKAVDLRALSDTPLVEGRHILIIDPRNERDPFLSLGEIGDTNNVERDVTKLGKEDLGDNEPVTVPDQRPCICRLGILKDDGGAFPW